MATYLTSESKGRYFVSMPDSSGNLDTLAHMRGSENLLMDMLEEKDWVAKSLSKIQGIWEKVNNEVFDIVKANNEGGSTIGWMNIWYPGRHAQMQCDISVMISPQLYNEFALPELEAQSNWVNKPLYHLDGVDQLKHLDTLLEIEKLAAIQWTHVAGQPSPVQYIPYLKKIQQAGKSLVLHLNKWDVGPILRELSSKGLLIISWVDNKNEAREIEKKAFELTHE